MLVFFVLFVLGNNGVYSFLTSRGSRRKGYNVASVASSVASGSATSTQPADLTPAVDKFMSVPPGTSPALPYFMTAKGPSPAGPDPFALVADELQPLSEFVKELVKSENPVLTMAASHFFDQVRCAPPSFISAAPPHLPPPQNKKHQTHSRLSNLTHDQRQGKRFRPTIVALMARAVSQGAGGVSPKTLELQLRLGQITEMIHVASLIHDDVLDEADTRRGGAAVHTMYTNKVAVLAGDYLLARASVLLARLHHFQVVEVMASALDALVQGEIMQARSKKEDLLDMGHYLRKSYFKTASLICSSCKSTALLAGFQEQDVEAVAAEEFGYHLGMAYQVVDDILDFTGASANLGKPAQADMQLGLATAPILFAAEANKALRPLIERRFKQDGDVQKAVALAAGTDCVAQSYNLAEFHAQRAVEALQRLPHSEHRDALFRLLHQALARKS